MRLVLPKLHLLANEKKNFEKERKKMKKKKRNKSKNESIKFVANVKKETNWSK